MTRLLLSLLALLVLVGAGLAGGASSKPTTTDPSQTASMIIPAKPGDPYSPQGYLAEITMVGMTAAEITAKTGISAQAQAEVAGCGVAGRGAIIRYKGFAGLGPVLWTYRSTVIWNYCHYLVTSIFLLIDEPVDTCCNWSWKGNIYRRILDPRPRVSVGVESKAQFGWCLPWPINWCEDRFPWVFQRVNGAGHRTSWYWGIGGGIL